MPGRQVFSAAGVWPGVAIGVLVVSWCQDFAVRWFGG